jgi:hypothetical protein
LRFLTNQNVQYFLLSKKSFSPELKKLKRFLTGECFVIYFDFYDLSFFYDFFKKIKK